MVAGARAQDVRKKTDENMYNTVRDDTAMNAAKATGHRTFPKFDSAFHGKHNEKMEFFIKVRFKYPGGNEYIWAESITWKNGRYWGIITDTPVHAIKVQLGEQVQIPPADIVDWMYGTRSVMHGGYTIRIIQSRMTKAEADRFKQEFPYHLVN
jgi:uncharacterized protein YegJ (DUF2314 family)